MPSQEEEVIQGWHTIGTLPDNSSSLSDLQQRTRNFKSMNQSTPSRGRGSGRGGRNREQRTPQGGRGGPPGGPSSPQPVKVHSGSGVPFGYVPAYLPGSASLVEELNQRVMIVLRDGKHLVGVSRLCVWFLEKNG